MVTWIKTADKSLYSNKLQLHDKSLFFPDLWCNKCVRNEFWQHGFFVFIFNLNFTVVLKSHQHINECKRILKLINKKSKIKKNNIALKRPPETKLAVLKINRANSKIIIIKKGPGLLRVNCHYDLYLVQMKWVDDPIWPSGPL